MTHPWSNPARRRSASGAWLLPLAGALLLFACMTAGREPTSDAPPQGWWERRGPVVPHDAFPADCSLCHVGDGWHEIRADFTFDHVAHTGVALAGAHAEAECLRCHNDKGPVAVFAARGCVGCHEDVHRGGLGDDCSLCHDETSWRPDERVASHQGTRFPLVGAHAAVACWRCHPGADVGLFQRADTACEACHQDDLARATAPDHVASGFTSGCDRCHVPTSWTGAGFKHPGFALTGGHAALDCAECHAGGVFTGTPTECFACHETEWLATTAPDHQAAGFPTTCEQCHSTSSWLGARFPHTSWPLTGAHRATSCSACHVGNVYQGTPTDCVACHLAEYEATTDPSHVAAGFPTTCEVCHTTTAWEGARFNHAFPITSGPHVGLSCNECHTVPSSFALFSCIDCHEHNQPDTDDDHDEVQGYVYESSACYACHPTGRE